MPIQTPREKLLTDKERCVRHQRIVDDPFVQEMLDVAMLQFIEQNPDNNDPVALSNYYRIMGARAFRKLFTTIADTPTQSPVTRSDRLDPAAEMYVAPPRPNRKPTP